MAAVFTLIGTVFCHINTCACICAHCYIPTSVFVQALMCSNTLLVHISNSCIGSYMYMYMLFDGCF